MRCVNDCDAMQTCDVHEGYSYAMTIDDVCVSCVCDTHEPMEPMEPISDSHDPIAKGKLQ
jgi:hypothetical protein